MTDDMKRIIASLPTDPTEFLTDEDQAAWDAWVERNRRRKARISMTTGIPVGEVG